MIQSEYFVIVYCYDPDVCFLQRLSPFLVTIFDRDKKELLWRLFSSFYRQFEFAKQVSEKSLSFVPFKIYTNLPQSWIESLVEAIEGNTEWRADEHFSIETPKGRIQLRKPRQISLSNSLEHEKEEKNISDIS